MIGFILFCTAIGCMAQTTKQVGNKFIATQVVYDTTTKYIYQDTKGVEYPMYISRNGKYYVWKLSKARNKYKYYIKVDTITSAK
jgi:hypothetical protein